jgi:hypothetical protein
MPKFRGSTGFESTGCGEYGDSYQGAYLTADEF